MMPMATSWSSSWSISISSGPLGGHRSVAQRRQVAPALHMLLPRLQPAGEEGHVVEPPVEQHPVEQRVLQILASNPARASHGGLPSAFGPA
jgi:hypothetical protein